MKRRLVAVTGASGFVGRWLLRHLAELRIDAAPLFAPGTADLTDSARVRRAIDELQPTHLVHLAAIAAPMEARRDPRAAFDVNLLGTLNIAEAILAHSPATRLIFASSSEVYGRSFRDAAAPLAEDAALEPGSLYGVTKASADMLLGQMGASGLDVVRFRPFNHTGPGQGDSYVVASFARQVARIEHGMQEPVIDVGDLTAERDFLDVRDVVRGYGLAITHEGELPAGVAINLASGTPRRIGIILEQLLAMSDAPISVRQDPARMRPNDTPLALGDASRALQLLNWKPQIAFQDTLRDVLDDWRSRVVG